MGVQGVTGTLVIGGKGWKGRVEADVSAHYNYYFLYMRHMYICESSDSCGFGIWFGGCFGDVIANLEVGLSSVNGDDLPHYGAFCIVC